MDWLKLGALGIAAIVAGGINAVAGGGSLISFPAAMAVGLPPMVANATNCVGVAPGNLAAAWAFRGQLRDDFGLATLLALGSALGGYVGARILLASSEARFEQVVPWLILMATLLLVFKDVLVKPRRQLADDERVSGSRLGILTACQFAVGVYGGYFGAGQGIATVAAFALVLPMGVLRITAHKCVVAAAANGVASAYFIANHMVDWPYAILMGTGTSIGGMGGGVLVRRLSPTTIRRIIISIGFLLFAIMGWRRWH